jgi:mannose-6-phosphate isomerase-like protein (cupin superfamily)
MTDTPIVRGKFGVPVDQAEVTRTWATRGFGCSIFVDPPGQEWLDFVHRTNELVTVVEGRLEVRVNGVSATLEPGDEIFIPKDGVHDVINKSSGVTKWLFGYD